MNANRPKNEMEFYCSEFSVNDLVNNYKFNELMEYYMYGLHTIKAIQEVIDNNEYYLVDKTYEEVKNDKMYFVLKCTIIKNAIKKLNLCDVITSNDNVFVIHSN
jgi:hypothetical protein